jgi:hypothetical protein
MENKLHLDTKKPPKWAKSKKRKNSSSFTYVGEYSSWRASWMQDNVVAFYVGIGNIPNVIVNFQNESLLDALMGHMFYICWCPDRMGILVTFSKENDKNGTFLGMEHPIVIEYLKYIDRKIEA